MCKLCRTITTTMTLFLLCRMYQTTSSETCARDQITISLGKVRLHKSLNNNRQSTGLAPTTTRRRPNSLEIKKGRQATRCRFHNIRPYGFRHSKSGLRHFPRRFSDGIHKILYEIYLLRLPQYVSFVRKKRIGI